MNRYRIVWMRSEGTWAVFDGSGPIVAFERLIDAENYVTRQTCPDEVEPA